MTDTKPLEITFDEWKEISRVPEFRESWGLEDLSDDEVKDLAHSVYGAKFDFISGGPGYYGDLFVLHGDAISGQPLVLLRDSETHRLIPAD